VRAYVNGMDYEPRKDKIDENEKEKLKGLNN
jgi:hypothetical protein